MVRLRTDGAALRRDGTAALVRLRGATARRFRPLGEVAFKVLGKSGACRAEARAQRGRKRVKGIEPSC